MDIEKSLNEIFDNNSYPDILDLTFDVIEALKGKKVTDSRFPDCQQLATKLFFHGATICYLKDGTKAPSPYSIGGTNFIDFAFAAVIVRAALETYLVLYDVYFGPSSENEFEFEYATWKLAGFVIRENYVPSDPAFKNDYETSQKQIHEIRERIKKTKKIQSLKPNQQKSVLQGKRIKNRKRTAKAAGFGEKTLTLLYKYYSGYVHADGLSASQIMASETRKEQVKMFKFHMIFMMILLSKLIVEYAKRFPESAKACLNKLEIFTHAKVYAISANFLRQTELNGI
jgi:hypothetical protein